MNYNALTGFLDPSRLSMGHQVGMGYTTFGGRGYSQGYYMNTISYRFKAPVVLRTRLGITNNPFASGGYNSPGTTSLGSAFNNAEFFGGADLDWRPKENILFRLSIDKLAPGMYYQGPYSRRWGMYNDPFLDPGGYRERRARDYFLD